MLVSVVKEKYGAVGEMTRGSDSEEEVECQGWPLEVSFTKIQVSVWGHVCS